MARYAKAFVGALIAACSSAEAALSNGASFGTKDYISAAIAGLIAFSGVAFITNKQ